MVQKVAFILLCDAFAKGSMEILENLEIYMMVQTVKILKKSRSKHDGSNGCVSVPVRCVRQGVHGVNGAFLLLCAAIELALFRQPITFD